MFPPIFSGERLRLAAPLPEDAEVFARWTQDDLYLRLLDDDPVRPEPPSRFEAFATGHDGATSTYFHLRTLDDDRLLGFVVLFNIKWRNQSAEMAIGIGSQADWGKGYGGDALRLILNYAFSELNLHRVGLTVLSYNERAIRAYERAGFVREGVLRQIVQRDGQRYDMFAYSILRDEWLPRG